MTAGSTSLPLVLVVGGGIGGLTAAIALRQKGFPVRVLERVARIDALGAGITVQINAMKALRTLGLDGAVARAGEVLSRGEIRTASGRVLRRMRQDDLAAHAGAPSVAIHRADLHQVLVDAAGDVLETDACVVAVETAARRQPSVRFADGRTLDAPIVIGADGLHSVVRTSMLGAEPLRDAGQISWRGVCARAAARDVDGGETWGRGARFGFVPINAQHVYWYAVIDRAAAPAVEADQRAALQRRFSAWHAPIQDLIAATPPASIIRTALVDRPPSSVWGFGGVTLLGDAAHPMTPNLGQGGCQAIEDAIVLARALAEQPCERGLRAYERARAARTRRFVDESWKMGQMAQTSNRLAASVRNVAVWAMPEALVRRSLEWAYAFE